MAVISLTIPDAILPRVLNAVSIKFDYNNNKQSGETQAQFAKRMLTINLKQWVLDGERPAIDATNQANIVNFQNDVNNNISIT